MEVEVEAMSLEAITSRKGTKGKWYKPNITIRFNSRKANISYNHESLFVQLCRSADYVPSIFVFETSEVGYIC